MTSAHVRIIASYSRFPFYNYRCSDLGLSYCVSEGARWPTWRGAPRTAARGAGRVPGRGRGAAAVCARRARRGRGGPRAGGPLPLRPALSSHSDARSDSKLNSSTTAAEVSLVVFCPHKLCETSPKPSSSKACNSVG